MKLTKTRLRSRMGEDTLEHTMRICIEGPDNLSNDTLEEIVKLQKLVKYPYDFHDYITKNGCD